MSLAITGPMIAANYTGAFDGATPDRRAALCDAGLATRPWRNGQAALPLPMDSGAPELPDFTAYERMASEYEVMGIYPQGHLMEFIRPKLGRGVLPATAVCGLEEGAEALGPAGPSPASTPRDRRHRVRHRQGRGGRRTADPMAPGLPAPPPPVAEQHHPGPRSYALLPRLALSGSGGCLIDGPNLVRMTSAILSHQIVISPSPRRRDPAPSGSPGSCRPASRRSGRPGRRRIALGGPTAGTRSGSSL